MSSPSIPSSYDTTKRLFKLAWPIIGLNVLQVLALAVDTAMVGRTGNAEVALTGMGYAAQLIFLLMVAMIGLTVGTVAFIARAKGAGHAERCSHILQQSVQLTVVLGVVVAVVGNALAVPLLSALGANETTMEPALDYFRPLLVGTVFNYLNILFAAALRGVGNTRLAFFVALGLNGLNAVLNYGLILGNYGLPALGNTGAALGTVAAQACAAAAMGVLLHRKTVPELSLRYRVEPLDRELTRSLLRVGWPAAADILVLNASLLSIVGMLGRVDQAAVAAHSIGIRVQSLAFVPGMSISQAVGAMVGQALGGNDVSAARRVLRSGVVLSVAIMTSLGTIIVLANHPIVEIFGVEKGTDLHAYSVQWLDLLGYGMPIVGVYIALSGLLTGAGATMISLRINTATTASDVAARIASAYRPT
ncbi:MAG: MATE family efflux transporter [Myxococcota bacterium]